MHLQALPVKSQIIEIKHLLECTCLWHFSVLWGKQLPSYIMLAVNAAAIGCVLSIASIFQVKTMLKFGIMYLFGCDPKQQQLKQDSLFLSCVNGSLGRQSRATATLQGQGVRFLLCCCSLFSTWLQNLHQLEMSYEHFCPLPIRTLLSSVIPIEQTY